MAMTTSQWRKGSTCNLTFAKGKSLIKSIFSHDTVSFEKMLPRDNKMFYITETQNLEKSRRDQPDFVDKLSYYDNVQEILRMLKRADHQSMHSSI